MTYEAVVVFRDTARMRLRLTGRGAFSSTRQRARWAACDALGAVPGEHTGPVDRVEITRGGRVVETVRLATNGAAHGFAPGAPVLAYQLADGALATWVAA